MTPNFDTKDVLMTSKAHHTTNVGYLNERQSKLSLIKQEQIDRERNKKGWEESGRLIPPNAFADDVIDNDVGYYYHHMTIVQGGLHYE